MVLAVATVVGSRIVASTPAPSMAQASTSPKYAYAEPGISPDGREIAFSSGGDIWSVPASGGNAHLLVADPAYDRRPLFSPDGQSLAFISSRTGGGDIYILTLGNGALRRLTFDDGLEQLDAWSGDSRWIYFSSSSHDIAGMNDIFRVSVGGGTPMAVTDDRYTSEFQASPSPNGDRLVFVARGNGSAQWWRKAGSHLDQSEIWMRDLTGRSDPLSSSIPKYAEYTKRDSRQLWPMWNAENNAIFYVSDRSGAENIWTRGAGVNGPDKQLTQFKDGRVLWPSIAKDGKTIAFERDFGIWVADAANRSPRAMNAIFLPSGDSARSWN